MDKRGWISKWPKCAVFIYSGGMDSTVTIARLLEEKKIEIFPLFINRGQSNFKYEKQAAEFFEKYFKEHYRNLFHDLTEIAVNIPPREIKDQLRQCSTKFGYPLRNNVLQMVGVQYAISLSQRLNNINCYRRKDAKENNSFYKSSNIAFLPRHSHREPVV